MSEDMAPVIRGGSDQDAENLSEKMSEADDHSVLQQPLNIGVKNVRQILKCIQSGSPEVKDLILNECNIIYECKVCLGLFRSLANFLYHKRSFCQKHLCESMLLFETFNEPEPTIVYPKAIEDETTNECENVPDGSPEVMDMNLSEQEQSEICVSPKQETTVNAEALKNINNTDPDVKDKACNVKDGDDFKKNVDNVKDGDDIKEETDILTIEPVAESSKKTGYSSPDEEGNLDSGGTDKFNERNSDKGHIKIPVILRPISKNKNAVFQIIGKNPLSISKKLLSVPVQPGAEKECKIEVVLPDDSKSNVSLSAKTKTPAQVKDVHLTRRKKLLNRSDCSVQELRCLHCKTQFTTIKTLYFHMMAYHSRSRMYYPCPFCKALFVQMYGVTRHLMHVHGKSKEQINSRLRDMIRKRIVWKRINKNSEELEPKLSSSESNPRTDENMPTLQDASDSECNIQSNYIKTEDSETETQPLEVQTESKVSDISVKDERKLTLHYCSKCNRVFGRKSSQVSHEKFCIMNPGVTEHIETPVLLPKYSPISPKPSYELQRKNFQESKGSERPKRGAEKRMHKDFVDSQTLKWRSANKIETALAKPKHDQPLKNTTKALERRVMSIVNVAKLMCLKCSRRFSSISNLRRHAAIHIGWTRYKCKCCDSYQSYNKSDCRHHIERMHQIPEAQVDKYVVYLASDISIQKSSNNSSSKSAKSNNLKSAKRKESLHGRKKQVEQSSPQRKMVSPQKTKGNKNGTKSASPSPEKYSLGRRMKIITFAKDENASLKKSPGSYKSVTTSNPTTIILSKTCSSSSIQIMKNNALVSDQNYSHDKRNSTTRVSIRKPEPDGKITKSSSGSPNKSVGSRSKANIVQILPYKVTTPPKYVLEKCASSLKTPEKESLKKSRPISDWFLKKPSLITPRRDSAPVIIDLVPASNSGIARSKPQT